MPNTYIHAIEHSRVYDIAIKTPLQKANKISQRLQADVFFKREDLQAVFSFKLRGAYNKIAQLSDAECQQGVICASAGNHAQGVAMSASMRHCPATIVMPQTTPAIKVDAVRSHGGKVILYGDSYSDACAHAEHLAEQDDLHFIHPYDDPAVIAGQGTIAKELLEQSQQAIDAVFIPIGGGGLIAGMAIYLKNLSPQTKIIGVEPQDSDAMYQSLQQGKRITLAQVGLFADGVAVKKVGHYTFELCQRYVDEIVRVSSDQICASIKDIFDDTRAIVEPAGALALAGLKVYAAQHDVSHQHLICINSGANMNFDRLRYIAERSEMGEQREALFAVTIPEQAGSFLRFCQQLKDCHITEFNYRKSDHIEAQVFVGIAIQQPNDIAKIAAKLEQQGYAVQNLTDNELAKLHLRYMVGGHSNQVQYEVLHRFEFPERPAALLDFLTGLAAGQWNISLFHYRNHGAAFGRVLLGMEVPAEEHEALHQCFDAIGYPYYEESGNPAFKLFL